MGKILFFAVIIIILILIIGWEIHLLRTDPRTSNKILFSIIPIILFVFFGYLLYLGIDREIYLHSAEATMETGVDGEYFNVVYRDLKKREVHLWCDDGSIEFDSNLVPSRSPLLSGQLLKGWKYHAEKPGEAWVVVWIYCEGNGRPEIESMEFYHLTVDSTNNIECEGIDAFMPAFLHKDIFGEYGTKKVIITQGNKSIKISDQSILNELYEKFQLAFGENYWSKPRIQEKDEYHLEVYYENGAQLDFYITKDGIMYGKNIGPHFYIDLRYYDNSNSYAGPSTDIEFIPDEDSSVDEILFLLDDLLANY